MSAPSVSLQVDSPPPSRVPTLGAAAKPDNTQRSDSETASINAPRHYSISASERGSALKNTHLAGTHYSSEDTYHIGNTSFAWADGIGSCQSVGSAMLGDYLTTIACEYIDAEISKGVEPEIRDVVYHVFEKATKFATSNPDKVGATTFSFAYITKDGELRAFTYGDSPFRIYNKNGVQIWESPDYSTYSTKPWETSFLQRLPAQISLNDLRTYHTQFEELPQEEKAGLREGEYLFESFTSEDFRAFWSDHVMDLSHLLAADETIDDVFSFDDDGLKRFVDRCMCHTRKLSQGDIVIAGSDGFFDNDDGSSVGFHLNVYPNASAEEIANYCQKFALQAMNGGPGKFNVPKNTQFAMECIERARYIWSVPDYCNREITRLKTLSNQEYAKQMISSFEALRDSELPYWQSLRDKIEQFVLYWSQEPQPAGLKQTGKEDDIVVLVVKYEAHASGSLPIIAPPVIEHLSKAASTGDPMMPGAEPALDETYHIALSTFTSLGLDDDS